MRNEKTQKFLSNARRILPHSPMLLVTHKTTLTVGLTQQWKKFGRSTQSLLPLLSESWDSHGPYYSLSWILRVLVWRASVWVLENCAYLTHFTLPVLSTTSTFTTKPWIYWVCHTEWNNITTVSTHDRAKIDAKLPEYHKRKVANHMMKGKNVEN